MNSMESRRERCRLLAHALCVDAITTSFPTQTLAITLTLALTRCRLLCAGQFPTDLSNEYLQAPWGAYIMLAGATRSAVTRGSPGWDAGFAPAALMILCPDMRPSPGRRALTAGRAFLLYP